MMQKENQIYITCSTHPKLARPKTVDVSYKHVYAPPSIEAEIIQDPKKSTECLKRQLVRALQSRSDFKTNIWKFLKERENFLMALKRVPEIKSFVNYILGLKADVEAELQIQVEAKLLEEALEGEVEETSRETESKIGKGFQKRMREYDNILDALSDAIRKEKNRGKDTLRNRIRDYVKSFLGLINWLIDQRLEIKRFKIPTGTFRQIIAELLTMDVIYISDTEDQVGTEKSVAVPLDFSIFRVGLVNLLAEDAVGTKVKNWNRMFYPPLFILWRNDILRLAKPYRTLDKHPIMVRVPSFSKIPENFLEDVERTLKDFQEYVDPLIRRIKGLTPTGKRGARPAFVTKHLANLISYYTDYNPLSIECLRIMDLGCGNGALLRDIYLRLLKEHKDLRSRVFMQVVLNDIIENPGKSFRKDFKREEFVNKLELYVWKGDLRNLIEEVGDKGSNFDVVLINRVFDLYGGYGIFRFDKKDLREVSSTVHTVATEVVGPYELDSKIVTFSNLRSYTELWRAISFLQNQDVQGGHDVVFLPAVEMDVLKNFFAWKNQIGLNLFRNLVNSAELILVSVFPGSFETLFPLEDPRREKISHCEIAEPNTYAIICLSKNRPLIDAIKTNIPSCS